jgi:hypothetical protein
MKFNKPFDQKNWKGINNYVDFGVKDKNIDDLFTTTIVKGTMA